MLTIFVYITSFNIISHKLSVVRKELPLNEDIFKIHKIRRDVADFEEKYTHRKIDKTHDWSYIQAVPTFIYPLEILFSHIMHLDGKSRFDLLA